MMLDPNWIQQLSQIVHDLKSPLSSTKTLLDGVEGVGELNERQLYFISRAKSKLLQMTGMINTIMEIAWLDADQALTISDVDLQALIKRGVDGLREAADERHVSLNM
jgi:signal transduction histidine kinase